MKEPIRWIQNPDIKRIKQLERKIWFVKIWFARLFHLFLGEGVGWGLLSFTKRPSLGQLGGLKIFLEWEMRGLTDLEHRSARQLVDLDNGVMSFPKQPKEENQLQTFASFTTEAELVWNYFSPIPFLPLSSVPITHSISNNSFQVANMWAWRIAKIPAPLPQKAAGLPQVGGGAWVLNQMQNFSYSLGQDILIYLLRIYLRLEVSNSRAQTSSLSLFAFISAFNLPILSWVHLLFSKTLWKHMAMSSTMIFSKPFPKARGWVEAWSPLQVSREQFC